MSFSSSERFSSRGAACTKTGGGGETGCGFAIGGSIAPAGGGGNAIPPNPGGGGIIAGGGIAAGGGGSAAGGGGSTAGAVSYTHLTLPTSDLV